MAALENYWTDDNINKLIEKRIARDANFRQAKSERLGWMQVVTDLKKEGGIKALNRVNVRKQWFTICELYKKFLNSDGENTRQTFTNKPYYETLKQFFDRNKVPFSRSKCTNQELRKRMTVRLLNFSSNADRWSVERTDALIDARIARHSMFKGRGHSAIAWKTITEDVMQVPDPTSAPLSVQQVKKKWENMFSKYKALYQAQDYESKWPHFEKMHHFYLEVYCAKRDEKEINDNENGKQFDIAPIILGDRWPTSRTKLLIDRRIARASMFRRGMSSGGWQAILNDLIEHGAPQDLTVSNVKKKWENLLTRHKIIKDSNIQTKWPHFDHMEKYHNLKKTPRHEEESFQGNVKEESVDLQVDEIIENSSIIEEKLSKCRLCQQLDGEYPLIDDKDLCDRIVECTAINIYENMETLPTVICANCKDTIDKYHEFIILCQTVDKNLRSDFEGIVVKIENNSDDSSSQENTMLKSLECSECPAYFTSSESLEIHLKSHKTGVKFHCEICNVGFTKQSSLYAHIQEHFEMSKVDLNVENVEIEYLDATENDLKSTEIENCDIEEEISQIIMADELFQCELCSETYTNELDLRNHLETHSRIEHHCIREGCGKKYTTLSSLRHHEMRHLGLSSFLCTICGKGFVTKNALKMHEKTHLETKEHICEICSRGFSVLSNLRTHQKKHHEGHRFYCSQCPKEFLTKCSLQRHELIHTGVKEFVCDVCSGAFYTLKELRKHKRYHENVRLYHCNFCFKTFYEKHHLTIHIRSHTGEKPFSCTVSGCSKSFREKQKLRRHEKIHYKPIQPV